VTDRGRLALTALAAVGCGWSFAFLTFGLRLEYQRELLLLPATVSGVAWASVFLRRWPWLFAVSYPALWLEFVREVWISWQSGSFWGLVVLGMWIWGPYLLGLPLCAASWTDWRAQMRDRKSHPSAMGESPPR
jgi:hypothetical protein